MRSTETRIPTDIERAADTLLSLALTVAKESNTLRAQQTAAAELFAQIQGGSSNLVDFAQIPALAAVLELLATSLRTWEAAVEAYERAALKEAAK